MLLFLFYVVFIDAWISKPARFVGRPTCSFPTLLSAADSSSDNTDSSKDPFEGISHLLDDGKGHIRPELATSIFNWEQEHREKDHLAKFEYSTRAGLRLVDEIAKSLLLTTTSSSSSTSTTTSNDRTATTYSDLVQEGIVALMYAMTKYDNSLQEESFHHYARRHIANTLQKVLAQESNVMTVPTHVLELLKRAKRKRQALFSKTGREPTTAEIATLLDISAQQLELYYILFGSALSVERTMEIYDPLLENKATFADQQEWEHEHGISLNEENVPQEEEQEGDDEMYIHLESVAAPLRDMIIDKDRFDNPNDVLVEEMLHDDVQEFLKKTLSERELQVIEWRFGLLNGGKVTSLEDIGTILGISAGRVAQIEEQAMEKLKTSYTNRQVETYLEEANSQVENENDGGARKE